jgi:hypothetical protein
MNSQVTAEIRDALKLNVGTEKIPEAIPVIEVGMKLTKNAISRTGGSAATGSATIYTTPTDQDFYLTGFNFSYSKNATCDVATGSINLTAFIQGANVAICLLSVLTLTAEKDTISVTLTHPIKIDRGKAIAISGTFTAGAMARNGAIYGYIDELSNA